MESLLYVFSITFFLVPGVHSLPSLSFPRGIKYKGTLFVGDTWETQGTLTLIDKDKPDFDDMVQVVRDKYEITLCWIDINKCPPSSLPTGEWICYCTGKTGTDVYNLNATITAKVWLSEEVIWAKLESEYLGGRNIKEKIGTLPTITERDYSKSSAKKPDLHYVGFLGIVIALLM